MTDDDWLTAAISDTAVVAEFLLSLHLPTSAPPPPSSSSSKRRRPAPPPTWTIRRSRTQPQPPHQPPIFNKSDTPRASPSTPLSWSGATSVSGGGCPPLPHVISGSKLDIQQSNNHFEAVNERRDKLFLPDLNVPVGEDGIVSY